MAKCFYKNSCRTLMFRLTNCKILENFGKFTIFINLSLSDEIFMLEKMSKEINIFEKKNLKRPRLTNVNVHFFKFRTLPCEILFFRKR